MAQRKGELSQSRHMAEATSFDGTNYATPPKSDDPDVPVRDVPSAGVLEGDIVHVEPVEPDESTLASADVPLGAVTAQAYAEAFGEDMNATLNLDTWSTGFDLGTLYERLEKEVRDAVEQERRTRRQVRELVFPRLAERPGAPASAGVYKVPLDRLEMCHKKVLFPGRVEACDGITVAHEGLSLDVVEVGVCLVSYRGDQGSWVHRLFRRDLRFRPADAVQEAMTLLERRFSGESDAVQRGLSDLARRGIMAFAERAILVDRSRAEWRMGHGPVIPVELLTGCGSPEFFERSLDYLFRLCLDHKKFVFVPSAGGMRFLNTIGDALMPMEYAIVDTAEGQIERILRGRRYPRKQRALLEDFAAQVGPAIVIGVYRVSRYSRSRVFYAPASYPHEAALIAMADSSLQEHKGFPTLLDLASNICRTTFASEVLLDSIRMAYLDAREITWPD